MKDKVESPASYNFWRFLTANEALNIDNLPKRIIFSPLASETTGGRWKLSMINNGSKTVHVVLLQLAILSNQLRSKMASIGRHQTEESFHCAWLWTNGITCTKILPQASEQQTIWVHCIFIASLMHELRINTAPFCRAQSKTDFDEKMGFKRIPISHDILKIK